jgi:mannosyltransferase
MSGVSTARISHSRLPAPSEGQPSRAARASPLASWWPLLAITLLAAVLRLATLDLQSFWYDEAFTPVHVLHASLWATLRSVEHSENTPPLWYVLAWADARVLGTGEVALRLPSALAGIATVPVAWGIGRELAGRRAAIVCALLVAVNPLFVWYSQEARAYGLFVLTGALAMLCFLRAERQPTRGRMALFALTGALALLTHYFAVFLLIPMVLWLLCGQRTRRAALPAVALLVLVGLALVPLILSQGGHGTQWIGRWPLLERLEAIPQYYLTGYSGKPLGRGVELLIALAILAALAVGCWRLTEAAPKAPSGAGASSPGPPVPPRSAEATDGRGPGAERGLVLALVIAACGVLIPLALVAFGADYLAPRNLVGAMVPLTAVVAVVTVWPRADGRGPGPVGAVLAATIALAFLAISLDVDLSPRLQRGNWRDLSRALAHGRADHAITTVALGSAPLEYYLPALHGLRAGRAVRVSEIDEVGYAPLRARAGEPPAPGFRLRARVDVDGLIAYRFVSPVPRMVSEATLRRHVIGLEGAPVVLVPAGSPVS